MPTITMGAPTLSPSVVPIGPTSPRALARVPFHEGELLAVAGPVDLEGDRPVPLRPFCDRLGLDHSAQLAKLRGKPWACVAIITTQIPGDDQARAVACLPLRALPMWLATINTRKVAPEARPMLEAYQREAAEVLYRFFLAPPALALPAAELAAELAELRQEVRRLAGGRWKLSARDAARVREFCEGRAVVTPEEVLTSAWEIPSWEVSERLIWAAARALRALGFAAPRHRRSNERSRFTRPALALAEGGAR